MNVARDRRRLRLDNLNILAPPPPLPDEGVSISVHEAKKLLKVVRLEKLKMKLREIPESSVTYSDFVNICVKCCDDEREGAELAKILDETGNVIVLGNIVFLKPEQVIN